MKLEDLGFNEGIQQSIDQEELKDFEIGRVVQEHKERYVVRTANSEMEAEITGHLRFSAKGREDFPAVGDWVLINAFDEAFAIIHKILPRYSIISRKAVGQFGELQIIATNIDYAFLVQAVDRDFNINRLERYLTICHASRVSPVIVLTKTDLIEVQRINEIKESIHQRIHDIPVIAISNETQDGYNELKAIIEKGKTYCMLGSSGVGKSTLSNNLSGKTIMRTDAISSSTNKGRHVTSHRELIVLEDGGILIDNPGMREVGVADAGSGLEATFDQIIELSQHCRYKDCTHTQEAGCAVIEAVENGELDENAYHNFLTLEREKEHFESTVAERRKKGKDLAKVIKNFKKGGYKDQY